MNIDTDSALTRARSLLGRVQRQEARFLRGRDRERANAVAILSGVRKKEGAGLSKPRDRRRHSKGTRPAWPCAPQCTRRAVPCRSSLSNRSIPSTSQHNFRLSWGFAALKRALGLSDAADANPVGEDAPGTPGAMAQRRSASTIASPRRPTRTSSRRSTAAVQEKSSNVSVNTYVSIQVQDIMEKAATNMATMMSSGARAAGDTADAARIKALRHQVSRAATYTAVCRRLEHALQLYSEAAPYHAPPRRQGLLFEDLNLADLSEQLRPRTTVADLPKRTLLAIFALLDHHELALHVAPVCRHWRQLAYHRSLWRHLLLDWTPVADAGLSRVAATCALLAAIPGLVTLELVGCAGVDQLLWQVAHSCRRLRTLAVDSCSVSEHLKTRLNNCPCVLTEVLNKCSNLHSLIVAFTPSLTQSSFFKTLGRKCWAMRCFFVSADAGDTRAFFESASCHAPGSTSREAVNGARATMFPTPTPTRTPSTRVIDVQTKSTPPEAASALLQWRRHRDHADASYFGVNVRVDLAEKL